MAGSTICRPVWKVETSERERGIIETPWAGGQPVSRVLALLVHLLFDCGFWFLEVEQGFVSAA